MPNSRDWSFLLRNMAKEFKLYRVLTSVVQKFLFIAGGNTNKLQNACNVCFAHGQANRVIFVVPRKYTLSSLPSLTFCCLSMLYFDADYISYSRVLLNICNGWSGVRLSVKIRILFFSTPCRPALVSTQPSRQCVPGYFHGVRCIYSWIFMVRQPYEA
jgi:hypothetical protein